MAEMPFFAFAEMRIFLYMRIFYFDLPPAAVAAGLLVKGQPAQILHQNFVQLAQQLFPETLLTSEPKCDILYTERKEREVLNYEEKRNNIGNLNCSI